MNVQVIQECLSRPINLLSVEKLVKDFTAFHGVEFDEASIYFVDVSAIAKLHDTFFQDPSPTDCISFPIDAPGEEGYKVLGDVFVCPEVAADYIKTHGGDLYREITLYTVHGLLHLLGYDDTNDYENKLMRAQEAKYLEHVLAKDLWIKP